MENSKLLTILVEVDEGTKTPFKAYNEILSEAEAAADAAWERAAARAAWIKAVAEAGLEADAAAAWIKAVAVAGLEADAAELEASKAEATEAWDKHMAAKKNK